MGKSIRHLSSSKVSGKHSTILELIRPLIKDLAELETVKKISLGKLKMIPTKVKKVTVSKLYDNDSALNLNFSANGVQDIRIFLNKDDTYNELFAMIKNFSLENDYIHKTTFEYG